MLDALELALRALAPEARDALESRWERERTPERQRLAEAERAAHEARHDGCGWG